MGDDDAVYAVFLCHDHTDEQTARWLWQRLNRQGLRAFLAEEDIPPGLRWASVIAGAVTRSRAFILTIGAGGLTRGMLNEIGYIDARAYSEDCLFLPILLEGGHSACLTEQFPLLTTRQWIKLGRSPAERHRSLRRIIAVLRGNLSHGTARGVVRWRIPELGFDEAFPDVHAVQMHFASNLPEEERAVQYFSDAPEAPIRHRPIVFRRGSPTLVGPADASLDLIAESLRSSLGEGRTAVVITDFAGDLRETLWALASRLSGGTNGGAKTVRWARGGRLLMKARTVRPPEAHVEVLVAREFQLDREPERGGGDLLERLLSIEPSLFVVDFSDVHVEEFLPLATSDSELQSKVREATNRAFDAIELFARSAGQRKHLTLVGVPRFLRASERVGGFLAGLDLIFKSRDLFGSGYDFRARRVCEALRTEALPEPLEKLLACNSNALSYIILAFLLDRHGLPPTTMEEWLALAEYLFRRGFHEIAYRLEAHCRADAPLQPHLARSLDVQWNGRERVVAVVDRPADLPRAMRRGTLVGDAGSGKTTVLQDIERKWTVPPITGEGELADVWLPLYFPVTRRPRRPLGEQLSSWLQKQAVGGGLPWEKLAVWGANNQLASLFASRLLLLVDGLDEVPAKEADSLAAELIDLSPTYGIIAASRDEGHFRDDRSFGLARLRPLATAQIEHYLAGGPPRGNGRRRRRRILDLLAEKDRPISGFVRNPYLLSCLAELADEPDFAERDLPKLSEAEILDQWLRLRRKGRGIENRAWQQIMNHLAKIALAWAKHEVTGGEVGEEARSWLGIACGLGVLHEPWRAKGRSFVRFTHSKLQTYFVALALVDQWRDDTDGVIRDCRWRGIRGIDDPLPLLMGLLPPDDRAELLTRVAEREPARALDCLQALSRREAFALPATEGVLRSQLQAAEKAEKPEEQDELKKLGHLDPRLATESAGDSFGERLFVSGIAYRFGKYPVTNLDFGRFVAEGGYENSDYWRAMGRIPDEGARWPKYWLSEGYDLPNAPVVGVCVFEALAYCDWLNTQLEATRNGKYRFALPTVDQWLWAAHGASPEARKLLRRVRHKLARAVNHDEEDAIDLAPELDELKPGIVYVEAALANRELGPVGLSGHQACGCRDLYGGVWEWCDEWMVQVHTGGREWAERPSQSPDRHPTYVLGGPIHEPFDPTFILVGGWFDPYLRFERVGFRIARLELKREPH